MNDYRTNTTFDEVAQRLLAARRILITTHGKPDGDAMGSCLALARALESRGKVASIFLAGPVERSLIVIAGITPFTLLENERPGDDYDAAVVLDTGAWSQLESIKPWLQKHHAKVIGIDHHPRGDAEVAAMRIIEPTAVSTTAILISLLDALGFEFCHGGGGVNSVPEALFAGLVTDSGWFRYPNAKAEAFEIAAKLLRCGIDKPRLYQILEESYSPARLAIEARALASLQYACGGSIAIITLTTQDFAETGAAVEELTGIVNLPMVVGQVRVSILVAQEKPGDAVKFSFRSKPAPPGAPAGQFVDVNALAAKFGGGGHVHAAGAKVRKDLPSAKADLLAVLEPLAG
jgi:bifunctional oligoribonuclease and PAP phosphatase NrnA